MTTTRRAALIFVFLWFAIGGTGHFIAPQFFVAIVPPWVPFPFDAVYLSGVAELAGAAGLLSTRFRSAAGIGLCVLIVCVTPANLYMLQEAQRFPQFPLALLWLRLPVQALLLACVWWSTRPPRADEGFNFPGDINGR